MSIRQRFSPSLAAALLAAGCGADPAPAPAPADGGPGGPVTRVTTVPAERRTVRRVTEEPGRVGAFETTPVHARLPGYVREVRVDIGDAVKAGQVLALVDAPEVEAEAQQAAAAVTRAEADARQAAAAVEVAAASLAAAEARRAEAEATTRRTEADLSRWKAEYARIEQLLRESAVTASLRDETQGKLESARAAAEETEAKVLSAAASVTEARAALTKARADVASAGAAVEVAKAGSRRASALYAYHEILAPFDGVVTHRQVDTGHLIVPGGASPPLFVVARVDKVTVAVDVPEADAGLVNPGDPASLRFQAQGGRVVEGKVTRTSLSLDDRSRTLRAEIDLPGDDGGGPIRPGQYAYATIVADERAAALTVPLSAVARDAGKTYVVVAEAGKATRRPVALGLSDGTFVEVVSGLAEGDAVVAANADALTEGQAVQAVPAEQPVGPSAKK